MSKSNDNSTSVSSKAEKRTSIARELVPVTRLTSRVKLTVVDGKVTLVRTEPAKAA